MEILINVLLTAVVCELYRRLMLRFGPKDGTFRIDRSNPQKDLYKLEIDIDLDEMVNRKAIIIRIDNDADLSQE